MIQKTTYNNDLYIKGEPCEITDTVTGVYYVPLDYIEGFKQLNPDKAILGHNYNVKRVNQDEFLPLNPTSINVMNTQSYFDDQRVDSITLIKNVYPKFDDPDKVMINFFALPFDCTVGEIREKIEEKIGIEKFCLPKDIRLYNITWNGTEMTHVHAEETDSGLKDEYIIKAGYPFFIVPDAGTQITSLTFYDKKIKLNHYHEVKIGGKDFYAVSTLWRCNAGTDKRSSNSVLMYGKSGPAIADVNRLTVGGNSCFIEYRGTDYDPQNDNSQTA